VLELLKFADSSLYTLIPIWPDETARTFGDPVGYRSASAEEVEDAHPNWDIFSEIVMGDSPEQMPQSGFTYMRSADASNISPFSSLLSLNVDLAYQTEHLFLLFLSGAFPALKQLKVSGYLQMGDEGQLEEFRTVARRSITRSVHFPLFFPLLCSVPPFSHFPFLPEPTQRTTVESFRRPPSISPLSPLVFRQKSFSLHHSGRRSCRRRSRSLASRIVLSWMSWTCEVWRSSWLAGKDESRWRR
jgi:hypothetical protein